MSQDIKKGDLMFQSEYVYKDEVATFMIELKDNELYLYYSDEKCCKILGLDYPCQDYICLTEIFSAEMYKLLLDVCYKIGITYNVISLTRKIYCPSSLKPYSLTLHSYPSTDRKLIYICCTDSTQPETYSFYEVSSDLGNVFYNVSFDMLFKLQQTQGNRLLLMNYNKSFLSYFNRSNEYYNYSDLFTLFPPAVFSFFAENSQLAITEGIAFSRLLDYKCTPLDIELYLCPPKNHFTLLVTFFPLYRQFSTTVLCCARDIMAEIEAKTQIQVLLEEYNALFTATANAVAIFNCENPYYPILEKCNPRMLELSQQFAYDKLFHSSIWHNVIRTHSTQEDMFSVAAQSKTLHFKVIIIPIIRDGIISKAIISIFDITDQVNLTNKNSIKLTKREEEIISYVITGEKNDFIAAKLCVSVGTVKKTLSNAYKKLGITSRVELINYLHSQQFGIKTQAISSCNTNIN